MATLTFGGTAYTVDHAAKGADYVRGYDADGNCVISLEGVGDFSVVEYDGVYMDPASCLSETCNDVKHVDGMLVRRDGTVIGVPSTANVLATAEVVE